MQQWLPLSTATFQAVVDVIPPPPEAQAIRMPHMLHPNKAVASSTPLQPRNHLETGLYTCDQSPQAEVVAYVSKMFAVRRGDLPQHKPKELTADEMRQRGKEERDRRATVQEEQPESNGTPMDDSHALEESMSGLDVNGASPPGGVVPPEATAESSEVLLGFSRIFSGVLRSGTRMIATLPKFDPSLSTQHPRNSRHVLHVTVRDLYMMMGRELVAVQEVPSGHVCAIGGLEGTVPRNATLWAPNAAGLVQDPGSLLNLAGVSMQVRLVVAR